MKRKTNKPRVFFSFEEWEEEVKFEEIMRKAFEITLICGEEEANRYLNEHRKQWLNTQDNTQEK